MSHTSFMWCYWMYLFKDGCHLFLGGDVLLVRSCQADTPAHHLSDVH